MDKKNFEKRGCDGRHLVIANKKKKVALGVVPIDSEFPVEQNRQKNFEKKLMLGRDLVIIVKLQIL